jgi:hypothetical protein
VGLPGDRFGWTARSADARGDRTVGRCPGLPATRRRRELPEQSVRQGYEETVWGVRGFLRVPGREDALPLDVFCALSVTGPEWPRKTGEPPDDAVSTTPTTGPPTRATRCDTSLPPANLGPVGCDDDVRPTGRPARPRRQNSVVRPKPASRTVPEISAPPGDESVVPSRPRCSSGRNAPLAVLPIAPPHTVSPPRRRVRRRFERVHGHSSGTRSGRGLWARNPARGVDATPN